MTADAAEPAVLASSRVSTSASGEGAELEISDRALVDAARSDRATFETIYRRYVGDIYRYCYARTGSRAAAEDATAQTFFQAIRSLQDYRGGRLSSWLFAIARNVTTDLLRRSRRESSLAADGESSDSGLTPEEQAIRASQREQLSTALQRLRKDQRTALELHLAGWTLADSAAAMGRSVGAVKMLRARALASLRNILMETEFER